jgi:hypothetical protein
MNRLLTILHDADLTALDVVCGVVCLAAIAACWILTS